MMNLMHKDFNQNFLLYFLQMLLFMYLELQEFYNKLKDMHY